jgi:hypothetical protein
LTKLLLPAPVTPITAMNAEGTLFVLRAMFAKCMESQVDEDEKMKVVVVGESAADQTQQLVSAAGSQTPASGWSKKSMPDYLRQGKVN